MTEAPAYIAKEVAAKEAVKPTLVKKASKLKGRDPESAEPSKPKLLIYGKAGVGKTWTSLDFEKPFYIDTESGADLTHYTAKLKAAGGRYFGVEDGSLDFETIIEQVQALATEEHPYKTLVIDSISNIFISEIANSADKIAKAKEKDEFGRSKKSAVAYSRRLLNWLQRIDMTVIMIAHEKPKWEDGEQTGVTFDAYEKLEFLLNLIIRITKEGESRKARISKSRLIAFPEGTAFDWSYAEFSKRYGKEIVEKKVEVIHLATEEQIKELNDLLETIKIEDGWMDKCLTKAKAESISELSQKQISAMIKSLKERIAK